MGTSAAEAEGGGGVDTVEKLRWGVGEGRVIL
jgi:hypothetical protein